MRVVESRLVSRVLTVIGVYWKRDGAQARWHEWSRELKGMTQLLQQKGISWQSRLPRPTRHCPRLTSGKQGSRWKRRRKQAMVMLKMRRGFRGEIRKKLQRLRNLELRLVTIMNEIC
jgi:hypothetical protein